MATHMKTGGSLKTDTFNTETSKGPDCEQKSTSEANSDYEIIDDDMLSDGGVDIANDIESHRTNDHDENDEDANADGVIVKIAMIMRMLILMPMMTS